MEEIQINQQLDPVQLSFHDRASLVVNDILTQIGFSEEKLRMITGVVSVINMLPSYGKIGEAQKALKEIEPLLFMAQTNRDPVAYIEQVPEQKIEYFINQVITRLEWVKYGNEGQENQSEETNNTEETNTETTNTIVPEHS